MVEKLITLVSHLPFMLVTHGKPHVNSTRIIEIVIFAAVFGGITYSELAHLKDSVQELKTSILEIKKDLYTPRSERDNWGTRPDNTFRN